jgi:hypothetical protein
MPDDLNTLNAAIRSLEDRIGALKTLAVKTLKGCKSCGKLFVDNSKRGRECCDQICQRVYERNSGLVDYTPTPQSQAVWTPDPLESSEAKHPSRQDYVERPPRCVIHRRNIPRRHYIYAWYQNDEILPFYIGKGTGRRAWAEHHITKNPLDKRPAYCERIRGQATSFRIEIIRDDLDGRTAYECERAFIDFFNSKGLRLSNQV